MRSIAATIAGAVLITACGGASDEPASPATTAPPVTTANAAPATSTVVTTTTTTRPPTTTATPTVTEVTAGPDDGYRVWDAAGYGFAVDLPESWVIIGEIDEATKRQVIGVMGIEASRELVAAPMVLAADPASAGDALFVAPVPPGAASGEYDEYAEIAALDDAALAAIAEMLSSSPGIEQATVRLAETGEGHLALVLTLRMFDLNFEMVTIAPVDGVAWTLVGSFADATYDAGVAGRFLASFRVTGVPSFPEPGPTDAELVEAEAGAPRVVGDVLARHDRSAAVDVAVGAVAPEVFGTDFAQGEVSIVHDGVPKAIVFLTHWCPHCRDEVPMVQAWLDETGGVAGIEVISVVTSYLPGRGNWPPSEWLAAEGWTVPVIRDDSAASVHVAYGAGGFPYWVFLDGDGAVALRVAGLIEIPDLEGILQALAG